VKHHFHTQETYLFLGETFLSHGNTKLNFRNIASLEAGSYVCLAGNVAGYKQLSLNVSVLGKLNNFKISSSVFYI